jgi:hypothetical protein
MRRFIRLLLFVSVIAAVQLMAQSAQEPPFSLTISTPQEIVKAGSEVRVDVVLRNTSDHEITLLRSPGTGRGELEFESDVLGEKGNLASQTKYGQQLKKSGLNAVEGSRIMFRLQPGETYEDSMSLNKLYDLSKPGKYKIQLHKRVPEHLGQGVVKSNALVITVTPS